MTQVRKFAGAILVFSALSSAASADEVHWRYDYTAARRESQQTGKPMFLDFSTEWCLPCKRLEKTTLRDPAIVQTLNERFIPVKLDGSKEKALADLLQVQVFPTLILAGADGRIIRNVEGFVEAARLRELLQEAADTAAANQARAALQEKLDAQAQQRRQRAAELLAQAKSDYQSQQYLCCLDRCVLLVQGFSDLPEGAEGGRLLEEIKANPQWMKSAADQLSLRLGEIHLAMAENWLSKGEAKLAAECLERVTAIVPGTHYADTARARLIQIAERASTTTSHRK
jgi:thioredoxin-like negative regulator of GroEL